MPPARLGETRAHDRPRERLRALGPGALTTVELLAILIGTGTSDHDAIAVAGSVLASADGSVRALARHPPGTLAAIRGVGAAKAARIAAALELGRRAGTEVERGDRVIRSPADVYRLCGPGLRDLAVEEFRLLALDTQHRVVRELLITRGLLDSSLVHPREVFRAAIAEAAAGIVVLHNHPSGNPAPSADDRAVTRQLVEAGRLLDIPVYDHVIVGGDRYFSFAEAGLL
jgi:DNA repair protein RadC